MYYKDKLYFQILKYSLQLQCTLSVVGEIPDERKQIFYQRTFGIFHPIQYITSIMRKFNKFRKIDIEAYGIIVIVPARHNM